jgi:hypothetical protein
MEGRDGGDVQGRRVCRSQRQRWFGRHSMRLGGQLHRRSAAFRLVRLREFGIWGFAYGWAGCWAFADVAGTVGASGEGVGGCGQADETSEDDRGFHVDGD